LPSHISPHNEKSSAIRGNKFRIYISVVNSSVIIQILIHKVTGRIGSGFTAYSVNEKRGLFRPLFPNLFKCPVFILI
jgi:hypothetical protein